MKLVYNISNRTIGKGEMCRIPKALDYHELDERAWKIPEQKSGGDKNMSKEIDAMPLKEFDKFLDGELNEIRGILASKSNDYSTNEDKLANFKLQARIDGITPIEALRGNWLKHRASIMQGLNELEQGKVRPIEWWEEKLRDDRNYNILLHALIQVTYFKNKSDDKSAKYHIFENPGCGWYVAKSNNHYLHKDLKFHHGTGYYENGEPPYGKAPGYYCSRAVAVVHLRAYLDINKGGD